MINTNPDRINIDSDDDDTITTDTPIAPTYNDNGFLPLDTTETHPLTIDTLEDRKRSLSEGNSGRTVIIKRRNASLYQSQDDDDNNTNSNDAYQSP